MRKFIGLMRKGRDKVSRELWKLIALIILEACVLALSYWIVGRFFAVEQFIYDVILIIFIFAVGLTIILRGNATRNRTLNTLGFIVFLVGVFVVIYKYEEFAVKISAFAALLVAFAAFASTEENRRIRRDSVERESRDRKERLIDEIARWLRELEGNIIPARGKVMTQISQIQDRMKGIKGIGFEQWLNIGEIDIDIVAVNNISVAMKEAEYYKKLILQIDEGLSKLVGVIGDDMEKRAIILSADITYRRGLLKKDKGGQSEDELPKDDNKTLEVSGSSREDIISGKLKRNGDTLRESIQKAIEKAIKLKVSLIEVS